MKKEIEFMDVPYKGFPWLAEHDYFCKYPTIETDLDTDDDSSPREVGQTSEEITEDSNFPLSENQDACNNPGSSSETETDSSDSDSNGASETDAAYLKRKWPWMNLNMFDNTADCVPMTSYEEDEFLEELERKIKTTHADEIDSSVRLMYRKLKVRKMKRERSLRVFNFDEYLKAYRERRHKEFIPTLLDRKKLFHIPPEVFQQVILSKAVYPDLSPVTSEYTDRVLKPYIWRDYSCQPPFLKVLNQITNRNAGTSESLHFIEQHHPIDYSYVKSEHIPAINTLCSQYFWPGIDVSDSLQYPDFTCVALYKKLIIGFAFMVPDVSATEAYITFLFTRPLWRGVGIASFMLYHLIQTCIGKDITLHVAADNVAVLLYQKFGFKVEQFIQNFYDKYFPISSKQCRHAFFLRLTR